MYKVNMQTLFSTKCINEILNGFPNAANGEKTQGTNLTGCPINYLLFVLQPIERGSTCPAPSEKLLNKIAKSMFHVKGIEYEKCPNQQ